MVKCDSNGITISCPVTSEDILNLAKAIDTARGVRLSGGYVINDHIIRNMINAMDEATQSYRKRIKEEAGSNGET